MKSRTWARTGTPAAALAIACAIGGPAGAAVVDALAVHALDIGMSQVDTALYNAGDANITCANPTVHGVVATPNRDTGVVLVRGTDAAVAEGECVSLTNKTFSITLQVQIERWSDAADAYVPVCSPGTATAASVTRTGVAATPAATVCNYDYTPTLMPGTKAPLHRAHAILTNSLNGDARHGFSEYVWPAGDAFTA